MRIRRLGLRRYGKFTDTELDFGARLADGPDLHIVYGPNEAGKSTVMSAVMDLLYGIHTQSKLNFLHPYPTMRIEAAIEHSAGPRNVSRIKRPQNSLLDEADRPIPEAALLGELGGLDRTAYQTMFCLDDETLETGGESILASKGDLGTLLFSATAGLADLSARLASVREQADDFFRPGKRTGALSDLKKELAALKDERDKVDTLASEFARLVADRDQAAAAYDAAVAQRGRTQSRIDEIGRLLNALPRLQGVRRLRAEIEPFAGLPDAPSAWAIDLPDLMTRQMKLQTQAQATDDEIARLERTIAETIVNEAACGLQDRIPDLMDKRARFVTAEKDLPDRKLALGLAEQFVSRILARINRAADPAPSRLILSTETTGPLHDLMEQRSGIEAAISGAETELAMARDALSGAEARLEGGSRGFDELAVRALEIAVGTARRGDDAARLRAADRTRQERSQEFDDALAGLHPWTGGRDALLTVQVARPDQLEAWTSVDAKLSQDIALRQKDVERLDAEALQIQRRSEALASVAGAVSDREVGEARSAREAAWAAHKAQLNATTAAAFETEMRKLDLISEQRLNHVGSAAELNQALLDCADVRTRREQADRSLQASRQQRETLDADIAAAARAIGEGLDETIGLAGLKLWLQKRERAVELRARLIAAEREAREVLADATTARERLATALRAADVAAPEEADIQALLAAGQAALDREAVTKALRTAIDDRRRDLKSRETKREEVLAAERAWSAAWAQACAACWLGENDSRPTIATVRETL